MVYYWKIILFQTLQIISQLHQGTLSAWYWCQENNSDNKKSAVSAALFRFYGIDVVNTERIFAILGNKSGVSRRYSRCWLTQRIRVYLVCGNKSVFHVILLFLRFFIRYKWSYVLADRLETLLLRHFRELLPFVRRYSHTDHAAEIPETQFRSNLITSSAILSISSEGIPACAGVVAIALSITSWG